MSDLFVDHRYLKFQHETQFLALDSIGYML